MITAQILADSQADHGGRLTTFLLTYPRFIHAELMTHRVFSRNASSSRAIPAKRMMEMVQENPALPVRWATSKAGMQGGPPLEDYDAALAEAIWLIGMQGAVATARRLIDLGVHKSIANRVMEPYAHMTTIVTATAWENFWQLRISPNAQPEFHELAWKMGAAYQASLPTHVSRGQWHLPFIREADRVTIAPLNLVLVSVARCARASYVNFYGKDSTEDDIRLHDDLATSGHWSPFEHQAKPLGRADAQAGNLQGWEQYRKHFPGEAGKGVDLATLLETNRPAWLGSTDEPE